MEVGGGSDHYTHCRNTTPREGSEGISEAREKNVPWADEEAAAEEEEEDAAVEEEAAGGSGGASVASAAAVCVGGGRGWGG